MGERKAPAKKGRGKKRLPIKRERFVDALLGPARGNQTKAARMAGYAQPTMEGSRLMRFDDVSEEIARRRAEMRTAMGADEIIERLSGIARADMTQFFDVEEVERDWTPQELELIEKARAAAQKAGQRFEDPPKPKEKRAYPNLSKGVVSGHGWLLKAIRPTKHGDAFEIESPKAALMDLAKIRGLVKQTAPPPPPVTMNVTLALRDLPEDALEAVVTAMAKHQAIPIEATSKT
jgi:phage terminase small subunit